MAKAEASPELEAAFLDFQKAQEHIGEQCAGGLLRLRIPTLSSLSFAFSVIYGRGPQVTIATAINDNKY